VSVSNMRVNLTVRRVGDRFHPFTAALAVTLHEEDQPLVCHSCPLVIVGGRPRAVYCVPVVTISASSDSLRDAARRLAGITRHVSYDSVSIRSASERICPYVSSTSLLFLWPSARPTEKAERIALPPDSVTTVVWRSIVAYVCRSECGLIRHESARGSLVDRSAAKASARALARSSCLLKLCIICPVLLGKSRPSCRPVRSR
jgi:hypothetical protein